MQYGFVIDQDKCIGCHACTVACKTEHAVPLGVDRTWVKYVEKGAWPDTKRFFSVMRCNHCIDAPCVNICPTTALFHRGDGIVDFDTDLCIGCKACMQACPYDALYIDPDENTAQKCNFCAHRVDVGLEPACVVVCPAGAIIAGDLHDPISNISQMVATEQLTQRAVEQGTRPKLWYKGAEQANLDPLGATTQGQTGSIFRDQRHEEHNSWMTVDLTPDAADPSARLSNGRPAEPPRVVYNNDHPMPWGWRVSSYFLTKGIAAGLVLVVALALALGAELNSWIRWVSPLIAGLFLAGTGLLLVLDLKRPDRFYYLLTKGNPSSWLVKGAWILSAFALVVGLWFLGGVFGLDWLVVSSTWVGAILGLGLAGYTAFLFGQAEGRDLWQSPTLLPHMLAGAFAAGGGFTLLASTFLTIGSTVGKASAISMITGAGVLGLIAFTEVTGRHPTRNIEEAVHHMTKGAFAKQWWFGGQLLGVALPIVAGVIFLNTGSLAVGVLGGLGAMAGIWFADDALVKAGQAVPLS